MIRRIELLLGIGTAIAAVAAIIATIFAPVATAGLSVDGAAPIIRHVYARDFGLIPMLVVIVSIAALAACVLLGAYYHTRRGSTFARYHMGSHACIHRAHSHKPATGQLRYISRVAGAGMRTGYADSVAA